jgi:hypothetical protein
MAVLCKTARYVDPPRIEIAIRPSSTSLLSPSKRMIIAIGPKLDASPKGYAYKTGMNPANHPLAQAMNSSKAVTVQYLAFSQ